MDALGLLTAVVPEVAALKGVPQSAPHHEDVLPHTVSVLRWLEVVTQCLGSEQPCMYEPLAQASSILAPHLHSLRKHLARGVDGGLDGRDVLRFAALFHDVGKRATLTIDADGRYRFFGHDDVGSEMAAQRLRLLSFSNDFINQVSRIVAEHMRPLMLVQAQGDSPSRRATYRFFKAGGTNGLDVALLSLADHLATHDGPGDEAQWTALVGLISSLFEFYFDRYDETVRPVMLVNGRDLMAHLDLPPGPEIGRILRLIEENQAAGEITSRAQALHFAESAHAAN
jgi:poly(A) polymerase